MVHCNEYMASTVDTDGLVLKHHGISGHSADYAPMRSQLFMGGFLFAELWERHFNIDMIFKIYIKTDLLIHQQV